MKVTEKVYAYIWRGRGNNSNTYLYAGEKTIIIDPGHIHNEMRENCLDTLLGSMQEDGFSPEQVELVLCTHSHADHCEAGSFFNEKYGIPVAMHKFEEGHMETLARFFEQMTGQKPNLPSIDIFLQEGELELDNNKDIIQALHTPGHSPGSLSFFIPQEKVMLSGDAVFHGSIGRTDFPDGSLQSLGQSVEKLSAVEGVEWLLPGHMGAVRGEADVQANYDMIKRMFF